MKRLLLCGYDDAMKELGDLTAPLMQAYASRHGYDFKCSRIYSKDVMPYWQKLYKVRDELDRYDEVHWMDSDIVITDPSRTFHPDSNIADIFLSRDWGIDAIEMTDISSCHFLIMGTASGRRLIDYAINLENNWPKEKLYDQDALRKSIVDTNTIFLPYARRIFNAVPIEVHESAPEPWEPGDWTAHLTMLPMEKRIALFHKIREQTKI
jgi:hypothetical protein